jgi:spore coat protein A
MRNFYFKLTVAFLLLLYGPVLFAQYPGSGQVSINPLSIPQFVDPLPHFAGLRLNATKSDNLIIKAVPTAQVAVSTGTVLDNGTVGITPGAGMGTYWAYSVSSNKGKKWTPPMWPAFTIEVQRNHPLQVTYRNGLAGQTYANVNIAVDQSIMWASPVVTGNPLTDPYTGPVPIVTHLHGGEVPSTSDGGPNAWFTPGYALKGSEFGQGVDSTYYYPNSQEAATLWYHDHTMGATRCNVYSGLAGFYLLRGPDEETDKLPGWTGDDLVQEVAPAGTSGTFNPAPYLPEIEVAIQDRMFDTKGQLYWPLDPPNPDLHPFWTPEFFGDVITVNGKTWPYLSVAPRKYRFRILDGSNARFYRLSLQNLVTNSAGPAFLQVGTDGGLLQNPVTIDPATGDVLFIAPGERADVVIDFSACAPGTVLTLMNDAASPYPMGDPVKAGTTDRIMRFVVNGKMVSAQNIHKPGKDKSKVPLNLRSKPMVKLTNFNGGTNVIPAVKRQLILNEVEGDFGPQMVLLNNSRFDEMGGMGQFGAVTELPVEGTTELWQIINTTMDAHPIHMHLVQFQLVSRQAYDPTWEMAYDASFPGEMRMAGVGPPKDYNTLNSDGAVGGNPSVSSYLTGPVMGADANEQGWKDTYKSFPGEVMTYMVRFAPTDIPVTRPPRAMKFGFDPSTGPGYVWHCHIVDHEDNEMMRPYKVIASPYRLKASFGPDLLAETSPAKEKTTREGFSLEQNRPNPFVSSTEIGFSIPEDCHVVLTLYNQTGVAVCKLIDANAPAGSHTVTLDASPLRAGVYFYQLRAGNFSEVKKLVLIK